MPILKLNLLPKLFEIAMDYQKYPSTKLKVSMLLLMSTFLKQNMFSDFYFLLFSLPMNFWLNHTSFLWCLCISLTSVRVQICRTAFAPASILLMNYALLKITFNLFGQGMVCLVEQECNHCTRACLYVILCMLNKNWNQSFQIETKK